MVVKWSDAPETSVPTFDHYNVPSLLGSPSDERSEEDLEYPAISDVASLIEAHREEMRSCIRMLAEQQEHHVNESVTSLQHSLENLVGDMMSKPASFRSGPADCTVMPNPILINHATEPDASIILENEMTITGETDQHLHDTCLNHYTELSSIAHKATTFVNHFHLQDAPRQTGSEFISLSYGKAQLQKQNQDKLTRFVQSQTFDTIIGILILANTVFLGFQVEQDYGSQGVAKVLDSIQIAFCILFAFELLLRLRFDLSSFFGKEWMWNISDAASVVASAIEVTVRMISENRSGSYFVLLRILKLARLLRVARLVRIKVFREMRLIIYSTVHCLKPLVWTVLLLLLVIYSFALVFTQAAREALADGSAQQVHKQLTKYYSTVEVSMKSLLAACLQGQDWAVIAEPLHSINEGYEMLFFVYILFTQLALLNVVTGIFVDSSMNSAMKDRQIVIQEEMMREGLNKQELLQLFREADTEDQGHLTIQKLQEYLLDERVTAYLKTLDVSYSDPRDLIECFESDADGLINADEFVRACMTFKSRQVADVCSALRQNMRLCHGIRHTLLHIEEMIRASQQPVNEASLANSLAALVPPTPINNVPAGSFTAIVPQISEPYSAGNGSESSSSTPVLKINI